jgi:hypothetical protein
MFRSSVLHVLPDLVSWTTAGSILLCKMEEKILTLSLNNPADELPVSALSTHL